MEVRVEKIKFSTVKFVLIFSHLSGITLKIVFVITRSDVIGGASIHLLDLASGIQLAGHEVIILVGGDGIFLEHAKERGLPCISLRYMVREINPVKDLLGYFELRRVVSSINPDIIHLHSSKAGMLGRMAAKSLSIPAVFTAHGWAFTEGVSIANRIVYRAIERFMARFTARIITVSEYDKKLALNSGVGNASLVTAVHNGMPDSLIKTTLRSADDAVKLIMVARFDIPKNHRALLDALAHVKHLAWEMEFVGDGPLLNSARQYAQELGLATRIIFSGACNDVVSRLARADVFFLISNWEGLPLTILEAMRAGLPVVASRVGGVSEAVDEGETGFLINRDDRRALVTAINSLVESGDRRRYMGENGRIKFSNHFTFEKMLQKTLAVYTEVLEASGKCS